MWFTSTPAPLLASSHLYFNLTETSASCRFNKQLLKLLIGFSMLRSPTSSQTPRHAAIPLSCSCNICRDAWYIQRAQDVRLPRGPKNHYFSVQKNPRNKLSMNVRAVRHQSFTSLHWYQLLHTSQIFDIFSISCLPRLDFIKAFSRDKTVLMQI